jgi:hypothetical protein
MDKDTYGRYLCGTLKATSTIDGMIPTPVGMLLMRIHPYKTGERSIAWHTPAWSHNFKTSKLSV